MKLLVKDIIKETADAVTVCFKNGSFFKKLSYKPGQFMTIHVPVENVIHKRAYSFSSNPFTDKDLRITIKRVDQGLISNYIHDYLKVGDKLIVDQPTGSFFVEPSKNKEKQYVFFAGGSGITPIFSIIKSVLVKESNSKIVLVYANQNFEGIIFREEIERLEKEYQNSFNVEHVLSENNQEKPNYHSGLLTEKVLLAIMNKHNLILGACNYMICGPFGYMECVKSILLDNAVALSKIKVEVFKSPKLTVVGENEECNVEINFNKESYKIKVPKNKSILQIAMANNIALPYSCRSGMCSTCKASCSQGNVVMTEGHFMPQKEVDQGQILTCISYPASENVVINL
ncbi:ferredoxin--NADP reductase [uncultured Maribacter sp.]|uniref:ferredoxin--NADP reductase n=1 Tax=uncultured Maribacter sp. TaxID=431308 RepID=UPI00260D056E|nr:ferredoxin--NADP reductase [uncultured Maribacter sp.]